MNKDLKITIAFNEANPEFYHRVTELDEKELGFIPYFEVDDMNPIEEYELLSKRLNEIGYKTTILNIKDDIETLIKHCKNDKPDLIFNFIEVYKDIGRLEMNVVGIFELLGIPYTGAPPMALANCQNKPLAKKILRSSGISTPNFKIFYNGFNDENFDLNFPVIVKPAYEDASVGIENSSIVSNKDALIKRIEHVKTEFAQPALVEEFIDGRELNVSIIGDKEIIPLPISEIDFTEMPKHLYNIVSYQAKWEPKNEAYHKTIPICPSELPIEIELEAKEMAMKAFRTMECRDYARVDIRLSKDNKLYVLEVNPNPDLTESAGLMRSAEAAGYEYEQTLELILDFASKRVIK